MNSPAVSPKPPIDSAELDSVLYEIGDMLKNLQNPQKIQEVLLKLQDSLLFEYVYNIDFGGVLILYSAAPFDQDTNIKYRELLKQMIEILNNTITDLPVMKKRRVVNYIVNTVKNIALS